MDSDFLKITDKDLENLGNGLANGKFVSNRLYKVRRSYFNKFHLHFERVLMDI